MKTIKIHKYQAKDSANLARFEARKGYKLLGTSSYKIDKSNKSSTYHTAILYLSPADSVAGVNVCPMAYIAECDEPCLNTSGRGAMTSVQLARQAKTALYRDYPAIFWAMLDADIKKFQRYCKRRGLIPVVRINGTSDLVVEVKAPWILTGNPDVVFYDYTKILTRDVSAFPNYSLTLSYSEANADYAKTALQQALKTRQNLAVVFGNAIPSTFLGLPVISGDDDDMRFLDPIDGPYVIALTAKGKAKNDTSGFVIHYYHDLESLLRESA